MPIKARPEDWDILFAPNAPRRGGPGRALIHVLAALLLLGLVSGGGVYAIRWNTQRVATANATATVLAATAFPFQTARAVTQTAVAGQATSTAVARRQPTPAPELGVGSVLRGGNLRREPRVAADTAIGLIWAGDAIAFLEQRTVDGQPWYRIRVTRPADNRGGEGVAAGTEGWASASLLSPPAQP